MAPSQLQEIYAWSVDSKVSYSVKVLLFDWLKTYLTVNLFRLKAVPISGRVQKNVSEITSEEFLSSMQTKLQHERFKNKYKSATFSFEDCSVLRTAFKSINFHGEFLLKSINLTRMTFKLRGV